MGPSSQEAACFNFKFNGSIRLQVWINFKFGMYSKTMHPGALIGQVRQRPRRMSFKFKVTADLPRR